MQLILNGGRVGTVRLLREQTVAMMTANQIGVLTVEEQPSVSPDILRPFPLGAGKDQFGFGFQIERPPASPDMRSVGSLSWGGVFNTHFWIDPHRSIAAVVLMQVARRASECRMKLCLEAESQVDRNGCRPVFRTIRPIACWRAFCPFSAAWRSNCSWAGRWR
jgi:CubicO group peptidase (beta-lactamase class C family)